MKSDLHPEYRPVVYQDTSSDFAFLTREELEREIDHPGSFTDELRRRDPQLITRFYCDPVRNRPSGAEPLEAFSARVNAAIGEILERHRGQHTLVVTHAGVIRATLTHVLQAPLGAMYRMSVATASISRIRSDGERPPTVLFHGRTRL